MIESPQQHEMSIYSWISCYIPKGYREAALEIAEEDGYRKEATLPENSWKCLEAHLLSKLGIKELSQWIANSYPPFEFTRVIEHITQTHNLSPELELGEKEWRELQEEYEKTTCK